MRGGATVTGDPQADAAPLAEAEEFLSAGELTGIGAGPARIPAVRDEIRATGTYVHTRHELIWGARLAWRNSLSCLGRPYWRSLEVRDRRGVTAPDDVFDACVEHLRSATNGGKVRLVLTAFAPADEKRRGVRILNSQLVQYAGYRQPDGTVIGDPKTVALTELARALGWPGGSGGPFDVLPLIVGRPGELPRWYPLPADAVLEVPISHPRLRWFADLGLRWYAHPAISDQRMRIGGVDYLAAPFSGWYTGTEVSARNLSDRSRYDMLPRVAERMGLDTGSNRTLWRDRALLELTEAVLHSYDKHGVVIVDHHFAAASFVRHEERERSAGREVYGRWRALVAPTAASTTDVYHREYQETVVVPNFFPQALPDFHGFQGMSR